MKKEILLIDNSMVIPAYTATRGLILKALEYDRILNENQLLFYLLENRYQLWVGQYNNGTNQKIANIFITRVLPSKDGGFMDVVYMAGEFDGWFELARSIFVDFAKINGCRESRIYGRPGWLKKLRGTGYKVSQIVFIYNIEENEKNPPEMFLQHKRSSNNDPLYGLNDS